MRRMSGHAGVSVEDDESESVVRTSSDQRAEELQVFWSYIVNMLINLESLPLDRIFQVYSQQEILRLHWGSEYRTFKLWNYWNSRQFSVCYSDAG